MKILKSLSPLISSPLSQIINDSFQSGMFSDKMKLPKVIPLFKEGCVHLIIDQFLFSLYSVKSLRKPCMSVSISS